MSERNQDDLLSRIREKHLGTGSEGPRKRKRRHGSLLERSVDRTRSFLGRHFRALSIALVVLILVGLGGWLFTRDYLTKRLAYPIRNVLYHCNQTIFFTAGSDPTLDGRLGDRTMTTIQKGNEDGTKLGDLMGVIRREVSDEVVQWQLEDRNQTRLAWASEKSERIQGGPSATGAIDFRERYAELIGKPGKFLTYTFNLERGLRNVELNVLQDASGKRTIVNELVTNRTPGLGWLWGTRFRGGTELNEFPNTDANRKHLDKLLETIDAYDRSSSLTKKERMNLVLEMLEIEASLEKLPIYVSEEDGFFDVLPQESTTWLFGGPDCKGDNCDPTTALDSGLPPLQLQNPAGDRRRIRVENQWDLWPGNYWLLDEIALGSPPNVLRPFARRNNGGYTIEDERGVIAQVVIVDFLLHYGDDLLYEYYLDKNGDGVIQKDMERVGSVLCRTDQDERSDDLGAKLGEQETRADLTHRFSYTFMAGKDWERRREEFYLCNTIESFVVNELNRGFGKHSLLGWINEERSNILLLEDLTVPNLGRALTPESSIVAKYDMVALLRAAQRSYVEDYIQVPGGSSTRP